MTYLLLDNESAEELVSQSRIKKVLSTWKSEHDPEVDRVGRTLKERKNRYEITCPTNSAMKWSSVLPTSLQIDQISPEGKQCWRIYSQGNLHRDENRQKRELQIRFRGIRSGIWRKQHTKYNGTQSIWCFAYETNWKYAEYLPIHEFLTYKVIHRERFLIL